MKMLQLCYLLALILHTRKKYSVYILGRKLFMVLQEGNCYWFTLIIDTLFIPYIPQDLYSKLVLFINLSMSPTTLTTNNRRSRTSMPWIGVTYPDGTRTHDLRLGKQRWYPATTEAGFNLINLHYWKLCRVLTHINYNFQDILWITIVQIQMTKCGNCALCLWS